MKIFGVACRAAEQRMADLFTGELQTRARLELEAHADRCARCHSALRDLATISVALDRAYAPLRGRATLLSPARVRLAARTEVRPNVRGWRVGLVGRLSEATMALGFAAIVLGGSFDVTNVDGSASSAGTGPIVAEPPARSVIRDYFKAQPPRDETAFLRWIRFHVVTTVASPVVRVPVGGQLDYAPITTEDDSLPIGAPR